jgi:exonuclease VII small subunit
LRLEEAARLSQEGYDRLTEDEQRRAVIVKNVATARLAMLVPAETALSNGGAVNDQALREYEQALEKARQAEAALAKL